MSMNFGERISDLRKRQGLTQEELAKLLGVTNQAVSKWESNKCCPDIELLPQIADVFKCSIDYLFNRQAGFVDTGNTYELCTEFPWMDDDVIRGVVCKGRKILSIKDGFMNKFTFEYIGEAKSVKSHCNLSVQGDVHGGCNAGNSITVNGNISGNCNAGNSVTVSYNMSGSCAAGNSITAMCDIHGACAAGKSITVARDIVGDIECKTANVTGDVAAKYIKGDVTCKELKCDNVDGKVKIK